MTQASTSTGTFPERTECDFTSPWYHDYRSRTSCGHCNSVILLTDALTVTKHTNSGDHTEHFCGEHCANEYYLEELRRVGL